MRQMRWWRARKLEAAIEAELANTPEPPWVQSSPEEWEQEWALPKSEDGAAPGLAEPSHADTAPPPDLTVELVRVLEVVTSMCGHVISFVEADREERRLTMEAEREERRTMLDALSLLINRLGDGTPALAPPRERILGGSMPAGAEPVIDLRELDASRPVSCRFGDQWLEGFEIAEKVEDDSGVRYRLRRRTDGAMLPELFAAEDIRIADFIDADGAPVPPVVGAWSAAITTPSTEAAEDHVAAAASGQALGTINEP
jgi:hypothetical protein